MTQPRLSAPVASGLASVSPGDVLGVRTLRPYPRPTAAERRVHVRTPRYLSAIVLAGMGSRAGLLPSAQAEARTGRMPGGNGRSGDRGAPR